MKILNIVNLNDLIICKNKIELYIYLPDFATQSNGDIDFIFINQFYYSTLKDKGNYFLLSNEISPY